MNKKVQKLAFILLLFFIAGTIAVLAQSYDDYALRGWRAGYNYARQNPNVKSAPSSHSHSAIRAAFRDAGVDPSSSADKEKRGAVYQGFVAGFWQQREDAKKNGS